MLGFITRSTKDFSDSISFKVLYCSLVRSILEFSSCTWNPIYSYHSGRIEKIQHRALRILGRKARSLELSYQSLERSFNLLPLSIRREMYDIITLYNILNSKIDTPELLQSVNINVPGYVTTRSTMPFRPPFVRTNYLQNSPIIRFQRSANLIREHLDLFFTSASAIKQFYLNQLEETG
ncbi:hypothetical protein M8J77_008580 [Diaphorina citri]|nr:hypothetical protein M8J77_008580 [Diaphorina citri]